MKLSTIERIQRKVSKIANGRDLKVKPGQFERFSDAVVDGDLIRQGDLYIIAAERGGAFAWDKFLKSNRYSLAIKPSPQLVRGNTQGAKHCLDSLDGVELWLPKEWSDDSLQGPFLRVSKERTVLHPTHGAVVLIPGSYLCTYQREYDKEQAKARRAAD